MGWSSEKGFFPAEAFVVGACLRLGEEVNLAVRVQDDDVDVGVVGREAVVLGRPEALPEVLAFFLEEANCFGGSEGGAQGR